MSSQLAGVPVVNKSSDVGGNLTYKCNYSDSSGVKIICRGPLQECRHLFNTSYLKHENTRYSADLTEKQTLTLTIRNLESNDQGLYWCYTESPDGTFNIHSKLNLTFGESP